MNMMLPLLLLDDDDKNKTSDNTNLLIMMMMSGGNMGDMNNILPLLLLDDDSVDFKNFFLYSNMLKQGKILDSNPESMEPHLTIEINFYKFSMNFLDCDTNTDSQFNMMMPLLLMDDDKNSTSNTLMLMMMMQSMGDSPIGMQQVIFI